MSSIKAENKYCAFMDVLGYGNIVASPTLSTEEKVKIFESIYMSLFASVSQTTKMMNRKEHGLFIKSFSDSIFIETSTPMPLLFTLYNIFNINFCYYSNFAFEDQYTPLLRSGAAYDWTFKLMDTGSLSRQSIDVMHNNADFQNIVGLGVAKAYYVSEKSKLSGMRIILEPSVLKEVNLIKYDKVPFECYYTKCPNYLYDEKLQHDLKEINLFFTPVKINEEGKTVNYYEICWPVFTYGWNEHNSDIRTHILELYKMECNFEGDSMRHFNKTAEIIYKSLLITVQEFPGFFDPKSIEETILVLQHLSGIKL